MSKRTHTEQSGEETETEEQYRRAKYRHLETLTRLPVEYETEDEPTSRARTVPVRVSKRYLSLQQLMKHDVPSSHDFLLKLIEEEISLSQQLRKLKNYYMEQQEKQRARVQNRSRWTYSLGFHMSLRRLQKNEILSRYRVSANDFKDTFRLANDNRVPSTTAVLLITMHSQMPVLKADSGDLTLSTFTVPPNVSITRFPFVTHGISYIFFETLEKVKTNLKQLVELFSTEYTLKAERRNTFFDTLDPGLYDGMLTLAKNVMKTYLDVATDTYKQRLFNNFTKFSRELSEDDLSGKEILTRVVDLDEQLHIMSFLFTPPPQLFLPGEVCLDKHYSLTEKDLHQPCWGISLHCPVNTEDDVQVRQYFIELVSIEKIKETVNYIKCYHPDEAEKSIRLPYCTVTYNKILETITVKTSLKELVETISENNNVRNFIVIDYSCSEISNTDGPYVHPYMAELMGKTVAARGMAGGWV
jgi:hypothetical protein